MRLSTALRLALTALLVMSLAGAVAATPSTISPPSEDGSTIQPAAQTNLQSLETQSPESTPEPPHPKQIIRISITEDGDAEWTIESRFLLSDEDDIDAFYEYAADVADGERDAGYSIEEFERVKADVQQATEREMSIENARWNEPRVEAPSDAELEAGAENDEIGVISFSFTWTSFGTVDGDRIYVHDVFQNDHATPIPSLTSDQRLVIEGPPNYEGATPGGDEGTYVWNGPLVFEDEPDLVFLSEGSSSLLLGLGWGAVGLVALAVLFGTGGYLLAQRRENVDWPPEIPAIPFPSRGPESDRTADGSETNPSTTAGGNPRDEHETAKLEFDESEDIDPSLLSDEERVKRLLHENGGRMKQASIVTETGWSNAKVSQLLSKMDENDEIEKLRIGRENLITLPEIDPTEID